MNSTVFVVEDERDIADLISHNLKAAGYEAKVFGSGIPALASAEVVPPALFLLDVMLPQLDGFDLCRRIRASRNFDASRVMFVSAHGSETDRVVGLELGADDYIVKPFSPRELIARVRAVLRRCDPSPQGSVVLVGEVKIDCGAMAISVAGRPVNATATEFRILEVLARSAGRVIGRSRLIEQVWGVESGIDTRSVDVYVSRLREKIEAGSETRYFKTIRGVGYRMDPPADQKSVGLADATAF